MNKPNPGTTKEKANSRTGGTEGTPSLQSKLVNSSSGTPFGKGANVSFFQNPVVQGNPTAGHSNLQEVTGSQSDTDNESPSMQFKRPQPSPTATGKKSEQKIVERVTDDLGSFTVKCSSVTPKLLNLVTGVFLFFWFYSYIEILQDTLLGTRLSPSTQTLDLEIFIGAALFVTIFVVHHSFKGRILQSETITFMRGVGIELAQVTVNKKSNAKFIPLTRVRDIFLYEHLSPCKVNAILALLVYGDNKLTIPFSVDSDYHSLSYG